MPPTYGFQTISDDLSDLAEESAGYFESRGYRLTIEPSELGFPFTPAFKAKRQGTTILVEVINKIDRTRIEQWISYSKTCSSDMRICLAVADSNLLQQDIESYLRQNGVGCVLYSANIVSERFAARDQAVAVHPPAINTLPRRLRELLGEAYDKLNQGNWPDAFEDMCRVIEVEARRRLKLARKRGAVLIGKYHSVNPKKIERLTMGELAIAYSELETQNHADSQIHQTLARINKDRVGVVHHRQKPHIQRRLRKNAGNHMWAIVQTLKIIGD
jgi:hypothetical protein